MPLSRGRWRLASSAVNKRMKGYAVTVRTPDSGFVSVEQRYERLERFLPFLLLAVPLIPYVLSQSPTAGAVGITVGVAVAAGAWIMWMVILHAGWTERRWLRASTSPG